MTKNMASGAIFTALHFLRNLRMGQQARVLHYTKLLRLARDKHSSLLSPLLSYKNEVLLI